ncbi:MAG: hypothetical protein ACJAS4_001562 [Bacteriovoracaceae bacterium]
MNKKLPISIFVALVISLIIVYTNTKSDKNTSNQKVVPVNSFSVVTKAKKATSEGINPRLISQIKNIDSKIISQVESKKASYMKFTHFSQTELGNNILHIEKERNELKAYLYDNNLKIDPIVEIKPRYLVVMAFYLNLNLSEITVNDIHNTGLNNKQIYTLKAYSESQDFLLLLKRGELSLEHIQSLINNS